MLGLGSFSVAIILKFFIVSEPGSSALSFCSGHWKFCSQTSSELEDASFFFLIIAIYTLGFLVAQIIKDLLAVRPRLDP